MEIDLKINFYDISLGMNFDPERLADAQFSKIGFFTKMIMPVKKKQGDTLYWAKNPVFSCFGERVIGTAMLDSSLGSEMMNGTSAYLFFNQNRLRYVIFQVIASYIAAFQFTNTFREVAAELLGSPEKLNFMEIPSTVMGVTTNESLHLQYCWRADDQYLVSEIGRSGKDTFVHWLTK